MPACASKRPPAQRLPMELLKNDRKRPKVVKITGSMVGVTLGPDGAPLDLALVTAIPVMADPEDGSAPFMTTSHDRGKFELDDLPPGNYGLTVAPPLANGIRRQGGTRNEVVAAGSYAGVVSVQAGETGPPILLRLRPQALVLRGHVTTETGQPIGSALVRAVRESPFEGDHFFARTDEEGHFVLGAPEGRYFLVAQADGRMSVRLDVTEGNAKTDLLMRLPPALTPPTQEDLAGWVSATGGALSSADGGDVAELRNLKALVGDARVVGLGEASYTAGEIARLRFRMFRHMVEHLGFSALMIEASRADVRALDDHVLHGKGKLADAVRGLGYFNLDTEETTALFTWMRAYNEDRRRRPKLRVFGVDVQRTAAAATFVSEFVAKVDKVFAASVDSTLTRLRVNELGADLKKRPADEQEAFERDVEKVAAHIEKYHHLYIAKSNWAEYTRAVEDAASLVWAVRVIRDERRRGEAMADMARRSLALLPPRSRVALFAHATQVSRRRDDGGMGALLHDGLKRDYVALGFTFYQGWVRAWDFTAGPATERGTKLFRLPPSEPGTLEALLDGAGHAMFYAGVEKAPGPVMAWLESRLPMRSVGVTFTTERRARTRTVVRDAFDGLVFVKKLTTVKFTETGKRPAQREWE